MICLVFCCELWVVTAASVPNYRYYWYCTV